METYQSSFTGEQIDEGIGRALGTTPGYDTTKTYGPGAIVVYESKMYVALQDGITGNWDPAKWQETDISGIVAALKEQIEVAKATAQTIAINVADWAGGTTCTKSVTGVTSTSIVIVDTSDGNVECTGQGAGTLTFTAMSTPTSAVTVKVVIM